MSEEEWDDSIGETLSEEIDESILPSNARLRRALRESWGAWADRDDIVDGASYVASIRRPLTDRLKDLGWTEEGGWTG